MHWCQESWLVSIAQHRNYSFPVVALAMWFLYDKGAWRLPKPWDLFGLEAMTTQHTQQHADTPMWLEDLTARKKSNTKRKGVLLVKQSKLG